MCVCVGQIGHIVTSLQPRNEVNIDCSFNDNCLISFVMIVVKEMVVVVMIKVTDGGGSDDTSDRWWWF